MLNVLKTEFDPTNPQHRKDFFDFMNGKMKNLSTWKLESPHASVIDMMKTKVSEYYLKNEFKGSGS